MLRPWSLNTGSAGRLDLNIVVFDRGRDNHRTGASDILSDMADMYDRAFLAQPFDIGALFHVRALHLIAQIHHDLSNARHADPANAHKVDCAQF